VGVKCSHQLKMWSEMLASEERRRRTGPCSGRLYWNDHNEGEAGVTPHLSLAGKPEERLMSLHTIHWLVSLRTFTGW
jgi:hypothetical protein